MIHLEFNYAEIYGHTHLFHRQYGLRHLGHKFGGEIFFAVLFNWSGFDDEARGVVLFALGLFGLGMGSRPVAFG